MNFFYVLAIAFGLAMDAFAVSLGLGFSIKNITPRQAFRLALHFGLFQFFMPILGWTAGENILRFIRHYDHWVAFGLLLVVGVKMILESFPKETNRKINDFDPTRGISLLILSLATSIDALAVGLSLSMLRIKIFFPAMTIGIIAFLMTLAGTKLGPLFGRIAGRRAELLGGLILIGIGIKILIDHL